jgi:hypothetical protein
MGANRATDYLPSPEDGRDPVSGTLCFLVFTIPDNGQVQKPSESECNEFCYSCTDFSPTNSNLETNDRTKETENGTEETDIVCPDTTVNYSWRREVSPETLRV